MLYREIIAVYSQIHTKHINTLCGQNVELYIKIYSVPRSKHTPSIIKTSQLMLYREIIAVYSQIHTKHINTLCGQNVEYVNVEPGGTSYNYRHLNINTIRFTIPNIRASEYLLTNRVLTSDLESAQENRKNAKITATIQ